MGNGIRGASGKRHHPPPNKRPEVASVPREKATPEAGSPPPMIVPVPLDLEIARPIASAAKLAMFATNRQARIWLRSGDGRCAWVTRNGWDGAAGFWVGLWMLVGCDQVWNDASFTGRLGRMLTSLLDDRYVPQELLTWIPALCDRILDPCLQLRTRIDVGD
jgi:hypothetical protein